MTNENETTGSDGLSLRVAPRGGSGRIVPEEAAAFDMTLENHGAAPRQVLSLEMNDTTPILAVRDASGALVVQASSLEASHRVVGEVGEPAPRNPRMVELAPGGAQTTWVNVWNYAAPLPPGKYTFEVEHRIPSLISNQAPFEIVSAEVEACALGYESSARQSSVLAWTAAPPGEAPQLYVRLSGFANHTTVQQGAFSFGPAPHGAQVAVAHRAGPGDWLGWTAVVASGSVELFRDNMSFPGYKSGRIALPIADARPVPRFPNRGHAVFLATGMREGHAALAGVVVSEGAPAGQPWAIPLSAPAKRAACAFGPTGEITLLLVSDDGATSRLSLLGIDESGAVTSPEREIRATSASIVAVAADLRPRADASFVVVEMERAVPGRLSGYRVRLPDGHVDVPPLADLGGWPAASAGGTARPLAAREVAVEVDLRNGSPQIAVIDERGFLHAGSLPGTLALVRKDSVSRCAHVACMRGHNTASAFTEQGMLFHTGAH